MEKLTECLILVDNSNIFIEGKKFAAKKKGTDQTEDWTWRIDFGALLKQVANDHAIISAILVGSTPPPNDSLWKSAKSQGFDVITYERSIYGGEEKAVDTELVAMGMDAIYGHPRPAILKLLSGDRDFIPLIKRAHNKGWEMELWGFSGSISYGLAQMVTRVQLLDYVFDKISKRVE